MRALLTILFLGSTAVAAPVPKELKKPDPFADKWNLRMMIIGGETIDLTGDGVSWNIDRDHVYTVTVAKPVEKIPVAAMNPPMGWIVTSTSAEPAQLRFDTALSNIEYGTGSQTRAGKYSLDGDTLTICIAVPGSPRPEKIERSKRSTTWIFNRVAK